MARANSDLLRAGQVITGAEEEHKTNISKKNLFKVFIIVCAILMAVSSAATYLAVKNTGKSDPATASSNQAVSQPASVSARSGTITAEPEAIHSVGILTNDDMKKIVRDCAYEAIKEKAFEDEHTMGLENVHINYDVSKMQFLGTSKLLENGVESSADAYGVDFHIVGTYDSGIVFMTRSFEVNFTRRIMKTDGNIRILGKKYTGFRTWS